MAEFLFFDVGGTLLHFSPSHAAAVGEALRDLGLDAPQELAADAVRSARRALGGRPDPVDLEANREWWMDLFGRIAGGFGCDPEGAVRDELYARHRAGDWLLPAGDTVSTLECLASRGHRMAVISNWDDTLTTILERRGLVRYFEFIVCSADVGAAKPALPIFQAALDRAGVPAAGAVHVGDEFIADVTGARGAGIRPVLIGDRSPVPDGDPVETIAHLAELAVLLTVAG